MYFPGREGFHAVPCPALPLGLSAFGAPFPTRQGKKMGTVPWRGGKAGPGQDQGPISEPGFLAQGGRSTEEGVTSLPWGGGFPGRR